ncbi:MAG: carbamoyl-phosphate synthase large subunit [Myxococcales bacterium]
MNPRVSRSSALASKATGFPIAKIAAKLAVGYSLDEIPNDITKKTPAAFEPALDYVVTKIPTFAFEKFPGAEATLGTQMKSVGEVMAIGRTLSESFFKALRSLEALQPWRPKDLSREDLVRLLSTPHENRIRAVVHALEQEQALPIDEISRLTGIDAWFVEQLQRFAQTQRGLRGQPLDELDDAALRQAKKLGFSDRRLASLTGADEQQVRERRRRAGLVPVFKRVDTCAGEFEASTPYLYSCYESEDESRPEPRRKVMILGSGANRIGQGVEFDYCCCHAAFALKKAGVQSLMVNCNPETVSTDYDTADRLYFEPLTLEDVLEVYEREKPEGVIVQFGGQTPLNLTAPLHAAGVPILGTSPDSIDLAEDRERFNALLDRLGILRPQNAFARSVQEAREQARRLGFPVLVRPSYVLGGRAMAVVYEERELERFVEAAFRASPHAAVLVDRFLEDAMELDVDALCDGRECVIAGILQHVEQAGIHSGDSAAVLPASRVAEHHLERIRAITRALARELKVVGLMNAQLAIAGGEVYVLEANPRASRTVPFLAKATGVPLAQVATRLMLGESLRSLGLDRDLEVSRHFVKAPVFPFVKFPGVDPRLGPEMTSTGEVMGIASSEGLAYHKAMLAAGTTLPDRGTALITVNDRDKEAVVPVARRLAQLGFALAATGGTAAALQRAGLPVEVLRKLHEGSPNLLDAVRSGRIQLIVNTPLGKGAQKDGWALRTTALQLNLPCLTTIPGAAAAAEAIAAARTGSLELTTLQELSASSHP